MSQPQNNPENAKKNAGDACIPEHNYAQARPCEDEIDLVEYIKIMYKHRKVIIGITVLSVLFAGIVGFFTPKMYQASATFFPMNTNYNIQSEGILMRSRLDIEDLSISVLESRKMADRIIEQLELKKIWNQKLTADARRKLNKASKVNLDKNGIIKLSVETESAELSSQIANAYVDHLDYFNRELDIGANRQIVQVIDRATVPEERMPRGIARNMILAALVSFMLSVFLVFFIEFIQSSNLKRRLKEV